jgi:hypothetical protein
VVAFGTLATLVLSATALAASLDFHEPGSSPEEAGAAPYSVVATDFDGDGDRDLAVSNAHANNVTILKNAGEGNFFEPASSPEATGAFPALLAAADLDGDGDQDLAVDNGNSNDVTILKNHGTGNFFEAGSSPEAAGGGPEQVAAADLDGDGDQDLAVANFESDDVTILKNAGAGNFFEAGSSPEAAGDGPASVVAADLDADGDQDLVTSNATSNDVTILKNGGAGHFFESTSSPEATGGFPRSVVVADLDGDGDLDLATANSQSDDVTILKNAGGGHFFEPGSSPEAAGDSPRSVAAADFDGDGDRDLAVANDNSNDVTVLENDGGGHFTEAASSPNPAGFEPSSVADADLDGDGDIDLAVANFSSHNVTILENR